jgi:hypothetical protein
MHAGMISAAKATTAETAAAAVSHTEQQAYTLHLNCLILTVQGLASHLSIRCCTLAKFSSSSAVCTSSGQTGVLLPVSRLRATKVKAADSQQPSSASLALLLLVLLLVLLAAPGSVQWSATAQASPAAALEHRICTCKLDLRVRWKREGVCVYVYEYLLVRRAAVAIAL